jgi:hypothetical protein
MNANEWNGAREWSRRKWPDSSTRRSEVTTDELRECCRGTAVFCELYSLAFGQIMAPRHS